MPPAEFTSSSSTQPKAGGQKFRWVKVRRKNVERKSYRPVVSNNLNFSSAPDEFSGATFGNRVNGTSMVFTAGGSGDRFTSGDSSAASFSSTTSDGKAEEAKEVNTGKVEGLNFAVGTNDSVCGCPKSESLKKQFYKNGRRQRSCRLGVGARNSSCCCLTSKGCKKKPLNSDSDLFYKSFLECKMRNLSVKDEGKDSSLRDDPDQFLFLGKGKENMSGSDNDNLHAFDAGIKSGQNSILFESESAFRSNDFIKFRYSGFGVFSFNTKSANVDDQKYHHNATSDISFRSGTSGKASLEIDGNQLHDTAFANGLLPEFRIGSDCVKKSVCKGGRALSKHKRNSRNRCYRNEGNKQNILENAMKLPDSSQMDYSPCEKAPTAQYTGGWPSGSTKICKENHFSSGTTDAGFFPGKCNATEQKEEVTTSSYEKSFAAKSSSNEFVFAVGMAPYEATASSKNRLRKKKNKRTARTSPSVAADTDTKPNIHRENETGESCSSNLRSENQPKGTEKLNINNAPSAAEICEKWRERGNHAFKTGNASKAEEFYTRGINVPDSSKKSAHCLKSLVICYGNRAAARMSLGKIREALEDCVEAAALDPSYLKAQIRAGKCHLLMGNVKNAKKYYESCLENTGDVCLDRRITIEAANGLQQSQKVEKFMKYAEELLEKNSPEAAQIGLEVVDEALAISPHSDDMLEIKAWFFFLLLRYEEVIHLCESTLGTADKQSVNDHSEIESCFSCKIWRWYLMSKSYFYMGRNDKSLYSLEKILQLGPKSITSRDSKADLESISSLAGTIRNLLFQKRAGNEAYKSGNYAVAVEHYTNALTCNLQSRPFAAICFCNRAAAYQALEQIADAIADCSQAIALDVNYAKAVSRRSMLYEMVRDYEQAAIDQQRFISLLQDKCNKQSSTATDNEELRQAIRRITFLQESSKKEKSLDLYLILGVKKTDLTSDIKKAYRKAALRHHPDKVCQYLARSESRHENTIWAEILKEVHVHADKLFKMIGEAYSVLSDSHKKQLYDADEEIHERKNKEKENSKNTSGNRRSNRNSKWAYEYY